MEVYIVTRTYVYLDDGYYDEKTNRALYRRESVEFEVKDNVFLSYIKAAKYIREMLETKDIEFGELEEHDMQLWDVFFIGFHHECQVHYKSNPILAKICKDENIPEPSRFVKYKIETRNLDTEILDEREELLRGIA